MKMMSTSDTADRDRLFAVRGRVWSSAPAGAVYARGLSSFESRREIARRLWLARLRTIGCVEGSRKVARATLENIDLLFRVALNPKCVTFCPGVSSRILIRNGRGTACSTASRSENPGSDEKS